MRRHQGRRLNSGRRRRSQFPASEMGRLGCRSGLQGPSSFTSLQSLQTLALRQPRLGGFQRGRLPAAKQHLPLYQKRARAARIKVLDLQRIAGHKESGRAAGAAGPGRDRPPRPNDPWSNHVRFRTGFPASQPETRPGTILRRAYDIGPIQRRRGGAAFGSLAGRRDPFFCRRAGCGAVLSLSRWRFYNAK